MTPPSAPPQRVSLHRLGSYRRDAVEKALCDLLEPLGGMSAFVKAGQKVLLKPNMLAGKDPAKAVTTHPEIVRGVILLAQKAGGIVSVGDSPGIGNPLAVARKCGILQVIEETGATFAPFADTTTLHCQGTTLQQLEIATDILEADVIINLPKLKSHQMMGLTCAVKNMFGAVVGLRKPGMHLQAGTDKGFFARILLDLCATLAPTLTLVDAVIGMEGEGPGSGDPVNIGVLVAGREPVAVDTVALELVGLKSSQVYTQQQAIATGRPFTDLEELELVGTPLDQLCISNFRPAVMTEIDFGLPGFLGRHLKQLLTARPRVDHGRCRLCNACVTHCPAQVMHIDKKGLHIDHNRCIRCFCCQELCPFGALTTEQGLLLRIGSRLRPLHRRQTSA